MTHTLRCTVTARTGETTISLIRGDEDSIGAQTQRLSARVLTGEIRAFSILRAQW